MTIEETAKEIYQYYHKQSIFHRTGKYPKFIKNWDKVKEKQDWPYVERFAMLVQKSAGQINYKVFINALFDFSNGQYFPLKLLISPKGIAIYNHYVKTINDESDPDKVKAGIIKSIKHIVKFCLKNNLKSFDDYFYKNANLYPPIILHYKAGSITKAFFVLIPNIEKKLKNFPEDIVADYFPDEVLKNFPTDRTLYISLSSAMQKFAFNFEDIVNHYIDKGWKEQEENSDK